MVFCTFSFAIWRTRRSNRNHGCSSKKNEMNTLKPLFFVVLGALGCAKSVVARMRPMRANERSGGPSSERSSEVLQDFSRFCWCFFGPSSEASIFVLLWFLPGFVFFGPYPRAFLGKEYRFAWVFTGVFKGF